MCQCIWVPSRICQLSLGYWLPSRRWMEGEEAKGFPQCWWHCRWTRKCEQERVMLLLHFPLHTVMHVVKVLWADMSIKTVAIKQNILKQILHWLRSSSVLCSFFCTDCNVCLCGSLTKKAFKNMAPNINELMRKMNTSATPGLDYCNALFSGCIVLKSLYKMPQPEGSLGLKNINISLLSLLLLTGSLLNVKSILTHSP